MASASDSDQFDVEKIVQVLVDDPHLLFNRGQLWGGLGIPLADVKQAEDRCRCSTITIHDLFTRMISSWKSKTNGSQKDLCNILSANGFKRSAG
jgi:hypothetical protein